MVLLLIIVSATAAASDFHPGGYDKDCVLCQINHLPLAESAAPPIIPENEVISWLSPCFDIGIQDSGFVVSLPGRSPPSR